MVINCYPIVIINKQASGLCERSSRSTFPKATSNQHKRQAGKHLRHIPLLHSLTHSLTYSFTHPFTHHSRHNMLFLRSHKGGSFTLLLVCTLNYYCPSIVAHQMKWFRLPLETFSFWFFGQKPKYLRATLKMLLLFRHTRFSLEGNNKTEWRMETTKKIIKYFKTNTLEKWL